MECSVFIFTVRINLKSFPWAVTSVQELSYRLPNFWQRPMSDVEPNTVLCLFHTIQPF